LAEIPTIRFIRKTRIIRRLDMIMKTDYNCEKFYETPEVNVYETRARAVICQSKGGIDDMENEDGTW